MNDLTTLVWIPSEGVIGEVVLQMAYGAIVNYSVGGIEFREMLTDEDYEALISLDDVMEEFDVD